MKPNYYAVLSAEVRYSDITPNAKLLYAEITAFCNMNGECFASNRYFAELYGKSKTTISNWIRELKEKGFIETSYTYKEGSKEIDKRYITILKGGIDKKELPPIKKTLKSNNTSNITTSNNINILAFRKMKFGTEVSQLSAELQIPVEMANDFLNYWTEQNTSGTKMLYEMQKTFDISLRLKRWEKNSKKFNKGHSKLDSQISEYLKAKELLK